MSYRWGLARQVACFLRHYRSRRGITTGSRWSQFSRQSRFRTIIKLDSSLSPIFLSLSLASGIRAFVTGNWKRGEQIPCPFTSPNWDFIHTYIRLLSWKSKYDEAQGWAILEKTKFQVFYSRWMKYQEAVRRKLSLVAELKFSWVRKKERAVSSYENTEKLWRGTFEFFTYHYRETLAFIINFYNKLTLPLRNNNTSHFLLFYYTFIYVFVITV